MQKELSKKVAIITGAGRGIGKAISLAFGKEGANTVLVSRTKNELENVAREIKKQGSEALIFVTNVSNQNDVKQVVMKTVNVFGRIDILVNNAGVAYRKLLKNTSEKEWEDTINTNLKGVFLFSKEVLSIMEKQRSGIIVNISSGAGKYGFPELSAYCASKFGVIGLTESLAREVKDGIKVYCVCPGGVDTKMHHDLFPEDSPEILVKPEKIAQKVLELCLPSCKVKSGECLEVYE